jgi:hypothetical protein
MNMKPFILICVALAAGFNGGCSKTEKASTPAPEAVHKFEPRPLHGGTLVKLGEVEYSIELVLDVSAGKLQAYIMDGDAEDFVRIPQASFEIIAGLPGREEVLTMKAVPNGTTGETVGDTSLFEVNSDWLKTTPGFDAVIKELTVGGNKYQNIAFNFPKGNDTDETEKKRP